MAIIEWTPGLSAGVETIDTDHKLLISLLNQLDDAVSAGESEDIVGSVLDALLDYTDYHFGREEALMRACGYPDVEPHAETHADLRDQVATIRDRYRRNPDSIREREVMAFLKTWLTAHIMGRDKLYEPFMASKAEAVAEADREFADSRDGDAGPERASAS